MRCAHRSNRPSAGQSIIYRFEAAGQMPAASFLCFDRLNQAIGQGISREVHGLAIEILQFSLIRALKGPDAGCRPYFNFAIIEA